MPLVSLSLLTIFHHETLTISISFQMRNRRLRRLGLIGGEAAAATECPTVTESASNQNEEIKTVVKNIVNHEIDSDNDEHDENQHKQKQLKIDETYDSNPSSDSLLNTNKNVVNDTAPKVVSVNNLAQRSRLLAEIEKQRSESKLNQTAPAPLKSANVSMETDDNNFTSDKLNDGDSGIENMETDETPAPIQTKVVDQEVDDKKKQKETEACLSRILDAFWGDQCDGQIIVSESAEFYKDCVGAAHDINYDDLAFQIIIEVIMQYFDGKRIDFKNTCDQSTSTPIRTDDLDGMDTTDINCGTPSMAPHNLPDQGACSYLIQSYVRCCTEHSHYSTAKNIKKYGSSVLDIIYSLKDQIVRSTIMILNGTLINRSSPSPKAHRSVLLDLLYEDAIPSDFLRHLTEVAYQDQELMSKIFGTIINNLFIDMQTRVICKKMDIAPINALYHLSNIAIINTADSSVVRPFCNLVAKLKNFDPELCTETPGREIAKLSFMGPFLSVSVFSEENPKLMEDEDDKMKAASGFNLQLVSSLCVFL